MFVWYIRKLLNIINDTTEGINDMKEAINAFSEHLQKIYKQETYYGDPTIERLIKHSNTVSFLNRFQVVNGKGFSHTVVAHIAMDGHYYIHPDEKQNRSISIREAARIQSFPDDYFFEGSRTAVFKQIGNAVPPLMAQKIAKKIREMV